MKKILFSAIFILFLFNIGFCDNVSSTPEKYEADIKRIIDNKLSEYYRTGGGEFSIYVEELQSGMSCGYNEEKVMNSASTIKLFMASVIYELDKENKLKLESTIEDPFTGKKYNLKSLTHRMVSHSVNDYFNILLRCIGKNKANAVISDIGAENTYFSNEIEPSSLGVSRALNLKRYGTSQSPTTTAKDLGLFLQLAYADYFGKENSSLLLDSLLKNIYHDRLPMAINFESEVAHKTGTISGSVYNDAGIVYLEDNPYIIVILSKNVRSNALGTIRNISRDIYTYHKQRAAVYNIQSNYENDPSLKTPCSPERLKKNRSDLMFEIIL